MGCRLRWVYVQLGAPRPPSTTCLGITVFHKSEDQAARRAAPGKGTCLGDAKVCRGKQGKILQASRAWTRGASGLLYTPHSLPSAESSQGSRQWPSCLSPPMGLRGSKGGHPASLCRVREVAHRFIKAIFKKDLGTSRM